MRHVGNFKPKNTEKYRGNYANIIYRSSYELKFMMWCDHNPNIIEWASEEIAIPYRSVLDEIKEKSRNLSYKKWHRYYVDFYVKIKTRDKKIVKYLVEVKPHHETMKPIVEGTNKSKKTILNQRITWIVNKAKWKAAEEYCKKRNMIFKIVTEKDLYGK